MRKSIKIILIILGIVLIGLAVYFLVFKNETQPPIDPDLSGFPKGDDSVTPDPNDPDSQVFPIDYKNIQTGGDPSQFGRNRLVQITNFAVAGATSIDAYKNAGGKTHIIINPVERADASGVENTDSCKKFNTFLDFGVKGDEVVSMQSFLKKYNFYANNVNGLFDEETRSAVKSFEITYAKEILNPQNTTVPTGRWNKYPILKANSLLDCENPLPASAPVETTITGVPADYSKQPIVRYVARGNGHIYDTNLSNISTSKIVNKTIASVHETHFGNKGNSIVFRYLDDAKSIITFGGLLDGRGEVSLGGSFFDQDIPFVATENDSPKVFSLIPKGDGILGFLSNFDNTSRREVFNFPITEWIPQVVGSSVFVTTKASGTALGYLYEINTLNSNLTRVIGEIPGFTTNVEPNREFMLYSDTADGLTLVGYDLINNINIETMLKTLPEKCVWTGTRGVALCAVPKVLANGIFPDAWYRGDIITQDDIWEVDLLRGTRDKLYDPSVDGQAFDVMSPTLDPSGEYLQFIDKEDLILWSLQLAQV